MCYQSCVCYLILSGPSGVVMCIVPIFIIIIIFASLNEFVLGSQVKVPKFTGCSVLRTVRLYRHNNTYSCRCTIVISCLQSEMFYYYIFDFSYLVVCFCIVEQQLKVTSELFNIIILLHL